MANVPNVNIGLPSLSRIRNTLFGCELGIDAIAASFIRDGAVVEEIRNIWYLTLDLPKIESLPWRKEFRRDLFSF